MAELLGVARLYFVLLAITAGGRWLMGAFDVPYEEGHYFFSISILTIISCLYYGAFLRRWLDYRLIRAALFGVLLGVTSQVLIFALTVASYAFGLDTYYNHPTALNTPEALPLSQALVVRLIGVIGNPIGTGVTAALGWALGGLLPKN